MEYVKPGRSGSITRQEFLRRMGSVGVAAAAAGPTRLDPTRAALSCGGGGVEGRGLGHASSFDRLPNSTMTAISIVTSASTTPIAEARPNCERAKAVS